MVMVVIWAQDQIRLLKDSTIPTNTVRHKTWWMTHSQDSWATSRIIDPRWLKKWVEVLPVMVSSRIISYFQKQVHKVGWWRHFIIASNQMQACPWMEMLKWMQLTWAKFQEESTPITIVQREPFKAWRCIYETDQLHAAVFLIILTAISMKYNKLMI